MIHKGALGPELSLEALDSAHWVACPDDEVTAAYRGAQGTRDRALAVEHRDPCVEGILQIDTWLSDRALRLD